MRTNGAGFEPNGGAFGYAAAPDGNQVLHLQRQGSATLSLTDLIVGQSYVVSFFASARPGYGALPVSISVDGCLLGTITPSVAAFKSYTGFRFIASGITGCLTFAGLNATPSASNDLNTAIDSVTLGGREPATWALMFAGFGLVGVGMCGSSRKLAVA